MLQKHLFQYVTHFLQAAKQYNNFVNAAYSVPERGQLEDLSLDETIKMETKDSCKLGNKPSDSKKNVEFD